MNISKVGSEFKELIDKWSVYYYESMSDDDKKSKIRLLIDGQDFIFFFSYHNEVYGASEIDRLTFARIKSGESTEDNFNATNLTDALKGSPSQNTFGIEEIEEIEVLTRAEVIEKLIHKKHKKHKSSEIVDKE